MATLSTAARNAAVDAVVQPYRDDTGSSLIFREGSNQATVGGPFTISSTVDGSVVILGATYSGFLADPPVTIDGVRIFGIDAEQPITGISVGLTGSGAEIELTGLVIATGQILILSDITITMPTS